MPRKYLFLTVIFLIGAFLRLYRLSDIPVGLHGDEASIGYNAYSLLKTARDQDGHFLPLAFDQFGNFRAAGYHYLDVPFVAVFGLTPLAVRLPAAIFGAITILVFYLFTRELFESDSVALPASFLLSILPWHINISRAGSEAIIASFFVIWGMYLLLKFSKQKTTSYAKLAGIVAVFLVSFFFYHAASPFVLLFVPSFFLVTFLMYHPTANKKIRAAVLCASLLIGLLLFLYVGKGLGRASQVSILSIPGGTGEVHQQTSEDANQLPIITRFFHNKFYFYERLFLTFYSEHLSGDFLFVNNGFPIRYKLLWNGNLYLIMAPFLIFGAAILLTEGIKSKKYLNLIPLLWLAYGVVPAAITFEDLPNVLRANLMIPGLLMITAFGFDESLKLLKKVSYKKTFITVCALLLLQNAILFLHNYFYHSPIHEPWYRSASEADLIFSVLDIAKGKRVIMTTHNNNNLIFYLFYTRMDPSEFQAMGSPREHDGLIFKNFVYTYNKCPIEGDPKVNALGNTDVIFVDKPECGLPKNAQVIKTIRTPDGLPSFTILKLLPATEL